MRPRSCLGACFRMAVAGRERETGGCGALVGHAALSVTCQGLFAISVPSDAGHSDAMLLPGI